MGEQKMIGVRYCGGCNPRYDRAAAVEQLRLRLPQLKFCTAQPSHGRILVVCGCAARCAETGDLSGELLWICSSKEMERAAIQLAAID